MLFNEPTDTKWVTVKCPVCLKPLGSKNRNEIKSFICRSEGCSQTEHIFYPGKIKRPERSIPQAEYYKKKTKCGCASCDPPEFEDD